MTARHNLRRLRNLQVFRLNEPRAHMALMLLVFSAIGATMITQPGRYDNTPAYANLLDFANQYIWGTTYLITAALMLLSIRFFTNRKLVVATHTISIALVAWWLTAFVVRYSTDSGTTIVNVCSWSVYLYLTVRSALLLDEHLESDRKPTR